MPLILPYGVVEVRDPQVIVHQFGSRDAKTTQRFYRGTRRRFAVRWQDLDVTERADLIALYNASKGSLTPFELILDGPGGAETLMVRFAGPLELDRLNGAVWSSSVELLVEPTDTPEYTTDTTVTRFPTETLETALLSQVQELFPLLIITPIDGAAHRISDRNVLVDTLEYAARLLDYSGISQSLGASDQARFVLGNADRYWTGWVNQVDFFKADVQFALYHANTDYKINLWRGFVTEWSFDGGSSFQLSASDGTYELRLPYPRRKITRQEGFVLPTDQQPVNVGGKKGVPRITATSVSNETAYGQALQDIWVNDATYPLRVTCPVIVGRDESEFFAGLGIVGRGPISAYGAIPLVLGGSTNHYGTIDGQPNHGPGNLGLRRSYGGNPATGSETQTNNNPDAGSDTLALDAVGGSLPTNPAPDGVAFMQIRRTDEKGIQPSNSTSPHEMIAFVAQGLGGWVWSGAGPYTRTWTAALTNPVWIAVNTYLRAKNLHAASQSAQEEVVDVAAALVTAGVCNQTVDKIVGTGTETQFTFTGRVAEEKPLGDWLREILACCLGNYTTSFGKLRITSRFHSGAQETFDDGNILFNSLSLGSASPQYSHLTVTFADRDYNYQQNTISFQDDDYVTKYGGPTKGNVNLAGVVTKSHAARLITCLLREQIGGITEDEWTRARKIAFQTTVLALAVEPGTVCSMAHVDMPDGVLEGEPQSDYGEFIVESWTLNSDFSITISGRSTTDSMYDLISGPKPVDVAVNPPLGEIDRAPGTFLFTPALYEYGTVSIEECSVSVGANRGMQSILCFAVYIDELTADVWASLDDSLDTTDPATFDVTPNPDQLTPGGTLAFEVGDYILFNDAGKYEISLLTGKTGNSWTLQRNWPGNAAEEAIFESLRYAHDAGVKLFKCQVRKFVFDAATGDYDDITDTSAIPGRFDMELPNACVVAIVAAVRNNYGTSQFTVYNCAQATVPGLRTLHGGNYTYQRGGNLLVADQVAISKRVQMPSSIRVIYASLETAPTGAAAIVKAQHSTDEGATWVDLETITIADGDVTNFDPDTNPPGDRRVPYSGSWPFAILRQEDLLNFSITQIGSTVVGADLTVEIFT